MLFMHLHCYNIHIDDTQIPKKKNNIVDSYIFTQKECLFIIFVINKTLI